jgi:hypothetical protein
MTNTAVDLGRAAKAVRALVIGSLFNHRAFAHGTILRGQKWLTPRLPWFYDLHHLGNYISGPLNTDGISGAKVQPFNLTEIVQRRP